MMQFVSMKSEDYQKSRKRDFSKRLRSPKEYSKLCIKWITMSYFMTAFFFSTIL